MSAKDETGPMGHNEKDETMKEKNTACPICREEHHPARTLTFDGVGVNSCGLYRERIATLRDEHRQLGPLFASAPEMLQALEFSAELIKLAREYFPKSIKNRDKFTLENACATIGTAIHHAKTPTL
jgi:hypothetical protein